MKPLFITILSGLSIIASQILSAGTITLADGTKISSPEIKEGQSKFTLKIGEKEHEFSGGRSEQSPISKPFHYFESTPSAPTLAYKKLIQKVGSAVVTVEVGTGGLGSGFIIHPDGYVITNQHVVSGSYKSPVKIKFHTTQDGIIKHEIFKKVRILAISHRYDIALLKIEGFPERHFPYVPIATAHDIEKGEEVVAVGAPKGMERTATKGFVSLSQRSRENMYMKEALFQLVYIQHTAEINQGNSGGPLFNMKGQGVGINSLGAPGSDGMGYAISADFLKFFLNNQDVYALSAKNMTSQYRYLTPPGLKEEE